MQQNLALYLLCFETLNLTIKYLDLKERKQQKTGENNTIMSFIICALQQIILG
jgi:hypothetical protein